MAERAPLLVLCGILGCVLPAVPLFGQAPLSPFALAPAKKKSLTPVQRKVDDNLRLTAARIETAGINRTNAERLDASRWLSSAVVRVDNQARIQVYLELTRVDEALLTTLQNEGIEVEIVNRDSRLVQAWVPSDSIGTVGSLDFVLQIRPPEYTIPARGSVGTEGDAILRADRVRSQLSVTGAGVKVGVISDGANNVDESQLTGDLPSTITFFGTCSTADGTTCNEGTAMMEIIYDLAPGVTLAMGAVSTSLAFIQRVNDLVGWGADVIVDDLGVFGQPYFEDGTVAEAYADAIAAGVVMVSAAGNDAEGHYQASYTNHGSLTLGGIEYSRPHSFGTGDATMNFTVPEGGDALVFLQWTNPFGQSGDD